MHLRATPTTPIRSERGFSLTEILVVLVLLGFTALVSIPNFMRMRVTYNDSAALREIAGTHDRARLEALKRHSQVGIVYDQSARMVTVFEDRNRNDPSAAGNDDGNLDAGEEVIARVRVQSCLSFEHPQGSAAINLPGSTALYRTDGSLNPAAGLDAAVYFGDVKLNYFRVRINAMTGGATFEKWMDGFWSKDRRAWQWKY